jgi:murein DD-endopeptidase MepM/ murein hydrolase activator NlpD
MDPARWSNTRATFSARKSRKMAGTAVAQGDTRRPRDQGSVTNERPRAMGPKMKPAGARIGSTVAALMLWGCGSVRGEPPPSMTPQAPAGTASPTAAARDEPVPGGGLLGPHSSTEPPVEPAGNGERAGAIERSRPLPNGLFNPMPGGTMAGYRADTGLDIAGAPGPVYAIAAGTLDYAEAGHTLWTGPRDGPYCVRIALDAPIAWGKRAITHVYYAHLSELTMTQPEGSATRRRVDAGERVGTSGMARGSPHLHVGLLLDGEVEQYAGTFLLEDEIRKVLGGYRNGQRLPR